MLDGIESEDPRCGYVEPVCGAHFLEKCQSDIHAIDNYCSRPVYDEQSGESYIAQEDDEVQQSVCGVLWSDEVITLSAIGGKGANPNERYLHHLKKMLEAVPNGRGLTLHTSSEFLLEEGEKFRLWVQSGQIDQVWDQMHGTWKNILGGHMEMQGELISIVRKGPGEFPQQSAALEKHCKERIEKWELYEREGQPEDDPTEPSWA
jgi:hypothetical protein